MSNNIDNKEVFVFRFMDIIKADYWLSKTLDKFQHDVVEVDKFQHKIEFDDSIFIFGTYHRFIIAGDRYEYSGDAIYVILDDPERFRTDTYILDNTAQI